MERSAHLIFLFCLFFAPLAFAGAKEWAAVLIEAAALTSCLLVAYSGRRGSMERDFRAAPGIVLLLLLLAFLLLQAVPLPPAVVSILSPEAYRLQIRFLGSDEAPGWLPLSLNPKSTLRQFFLWGSCAMFYWTSVQLLADANRLKRTVRAVAIFGGLLSYVAIFQFFTAGDRIYWLFPAAGASPFGPFYNRNHFAALMGMILPLSLAVFLHSIPRGAYSSWRDWVVAVWGRRTGIVHLLLGVSVVVVAVSVFVSLSRGGIVGLCLGTATFAMLLLHRFRQGRGKLVLAGVTALVLLSVTWFGWEPIVRRFELIAGEDRLLSQLRLHYWRDSVGILRDFTLTGSGFGTFADAYRPYRTVDDHAVLTHAQSDYLELLTDGGIVGALLVAGFWAAVLRAAVSRGLRRHERYSLYLLSGCLGGLVAIGAHSFTDFNLRIPANNLYLFFLAGLAVSAAHTRLREESGSGAEDAGTFLPVAISWGRWPRRVFPVLFALAAIRFHGGTLMGAYYYSRIADVDPGARLTPEARRRYRDTAKKAWVFDPLEAEYAMAAARGEMIGGDLDAAAGSAVRSLGLSPNRGYQLQEAAGIFELKGDLSRAEQLMRAGVAADPTNPYRNRQLAAWLLARGRSVEGLDYLHKAMAREPERTRDYVALMLLNGIGEKAISAALPDRVAAHLRFGDYLRESGRGALAEQHLTRAVWLLARYGISVARLYLQVAARYEAGKRFEESLAVVLKGCAAIPDNAWLHVLAARLYLKLENPDRAAEEYQEALRLDVRNQEARRELGRLRSGVDSP